MFCRNLTILCIGLVLVAVPALAQDCSTQATVGNFDVTFEGAVFDGSSTEFEYCITGLDVPDFHALSNWELALDPGCIAAGDITACSPEPCFYQVDDPNTGITGIKFDDVVVDVDQTACFSFSLAGDWTGMIGETTVGLKAATDVFFFGSLCGPVCVGCGAALDVVFENGAPLLSVTVTHNRPPTVTGSAVFQIVDKFGAVVHEWTDGPITLAQGGSYRVLGPIPDLPALPSGRYKIKMKLGGMSTWAVRTAFFTVP